VTRRIDVNETNNALRKSDERMFWPCRTHGGLVGGITFLMGEGVSNCQESSPLMAQDSKVEAEIAGFDRSRPNDMFVCGSTVVFGQINPDWDCPQANHMSTSFKTYNLICSF
jgi:hypothetical protein